MKNIYTVAHTHWDFEWYFTRQEARVQFIFHMDEVLEALETNQLDFYTLDGQMSIIEDYLSIFPEKKAQIKKFVCAGRLFIGPWFTQIDEMTTSGESIVRNLKLGIQEAKALGDVMRVGYLPDSFGQGQDMPKIYQGFDIPYAIFWRGMPKEANARYFYWSSNDGSKVLTANIKNGYYAGVDLIEQENVENLIQRITTQTAGQMHLLPVGGDQRAVDFQLKERIALANQKSEIETQFIESNYPAFFQALEKEAGHLAELSGEFIEPSDSKIHRGIYSSRYDLKQLYDHLERVLTYQLEPMFVLAKCYGISVKQGLLNHLWKVVARGQAHDSAGGCNSDKTNQDIYMRGVNGLQEAQSCMDYLLRKLSISLNKGKKNDLFLWNPLPFQLTTIRKIEVSTKNKAFTLHDNEGQPVHFDILEQKRENAALLRRNPAEMAKDHYYVTTIALECTLPAMGWLTYQITEVNEEPRLLIERNEIENDWYTLQFQEGSFHLYSKKTDQWHYDFLRIEDSGDEGDTYDYSPAFADWLLDLDFSNSTNVSIQQGTLVSRILVSGVWRLPYQLSSRKEKMLDGEVAYTLELQLNKKNNLIDLQLKLDNQVLDHRLRLMIKTAGHAAYSYSDTPFGVIARPIEDPHLQDWRKIGYKEEPTSMRPMLHFANLHSENESWTFLSRGTKDFQIIDQEYQYLAITIFRGVGYLGRPDILRRPGDASGLQTKVVATPDSQLLGDIFFEGSICLDQVFDAQKLQMAYLSTTQRNLHYQIQTMNRFTTAIEYFPINPLTLSHIANNTIAIEALSVVFSSMLPSVDGTGIELRFYNQLSRKTKPNPGKLVFTQPVDVGLLNLEGKMIRSIATQVRTLDMAAFDSGEIRTYGIFFQKI